MTTKDGGKLKLDALIRVSRVGGREGDGFISPDVQREQIEAWAKLRGVEILEWETELDKSGGTMERPGLTAIMERIRAGETGGIVVAKLDRFARTLSGGLQTIHEIEEVYGATFASLDLGLDPTTPEGRLFRNFMLTLAEFERERIKRGWDTARKRAVGRGVHLRTPFGYDRDEETGRLVPNENAPLVREAFERRAAGGEHGTLGAIAGYLNEHATTTSGAAWQPATVSKLFSYESYTGVAYSGDHRHEDAHPAIVSRSLFLAAEKVRGLNPRKTNDDPRLLDDPQLLGGLVRCAACRYTAKRGKGKSRAGRALTYRCKADHGGGRCPAPFTMSEPKLEAYVIEAIGQRFGDRSHWRLGSGGEKVTSEELTAATRRRERAETELVAWRDDFELRDRLDREQYLAGFDTRQEELRDAQAEEERLLAAQGREAARIEVEDSWPPEIPEWSYEVDPDDTLGGRRFVRELTAIRIRQMVDCIFVERDGQRPASERVHICWAGEGPDDLPRRGKRAEPIRPFVRSEATL